MKIKKKRQICNSGEYYKLLTFKTVKRYSSINIKKHMTFFLIKSEFIWKIIFNFAPYSMPAY